MASQSPERKLTYQDFEKLPEDGRRHEILDGVHIVSPSPGSRHQEVLGSLYLLVGGFVRARQLGRAFFAPLDVVLSEHDIVEPDLLFVAKERLGIVGEENLHGAPDLVVEVLSPSSRRRDLGKKRVRYELLGVQEYWAVDPKAETILVFRRQGDGFLPPVRLSAEAGDRLTSPLLPGLEISPREVFGS